MIFSSIDLLNNNVVQLEKGNTIVLKFNDPKYFLEQFSKYFQTTIVDIDAARGKGNHKEIIKELCKVNSCRVGGGIREIKYAKELVSWGATKIIIGTNIFSNNRINHTFLKDLKETVGKDNIILALDNCENIIQTHGWTQNTIYNIKEVIGELEQYCSEFLITLIENEGLLKGINYHKVYEYKHLTNNTITIAGGITNIEDIKLLTNLGYNMQIGMAFYKKIINIADAFISSLNWGKSLLIPTIVQDRSGSVLMLGFSNQESIKKTIETNEMWYYSRSRKKLWKKGETSGNIQKLIRLRPDCDNDSLLATVEQIGNACHTGNQSCFQEYSFKLRMLFEIVNDRILKQSSNSYTCKLEPNLLREKIQEESLELLQANSSDEIIHEAADLIYFITVLLVKNNINYSDVMWELNRRNKEKN